MFDLTFSGTQVLLGTAMLVLSLVGFYAILKYYFNKEEKPPGNETSERTKYATADVFRLQPIFFKVGLMTVLAFALMAFNWTQFSVRALPAANQNLEFVDLDNAPPITTQKPPPPPVPPVPEIEVVPDELVKKSKTFDSMDARLNEVIKAPPPPQKKLPPPPPIDDGAKTNIPWKVVERMPVYGDCTGGADEATRRNCSNTTLIKFISQEVKYPVLAREVGISGTAVIRFVIEKDGRMTHLELIRDPGGNLGKEAMRVGQLMAEQHSWTPGEQRGRRVRVQFNLPVKFTLQ